MGGIYALIIMPIGAKTRPMAASAGARPGDGALNQRADSAGNYSNYSNTLPSLDCLTYGN